MLFQELFDFLRCLMWRRVNVMELEIEVTTRLVTTHEAQKESLPVIKNTLMSILDKGVQQHKHC